MHITPLPLVCPRGITDMRSSVYTIGWNAVDIRQFPKIGIPHKDTGWLMSRIFRWGNFFSCWDRR